MKKGRFVIKWDSKSGGTFAQIEYSKTEAIKTISEMLSDESILSVTVKKETI